MSAVAKVFCEKTNDGRLKAFIFLSENQIPRATIKRVHREVFCIIPEYDKVEQGTWKFSVLIQSKDVAATFRKEIYLWKVLVRIDAEHTADIASFTLQ
jgi:hypothetical protein